MPGSGGGKTSSGTSSTFSPYSATLGMFARQRNNESQQVLKPLAAQTQEALQTGGVNARIPIVNANLAAAKTAASSSMNSIKDHLAQSGLLNSSFGQEILAKQGSETSQEIAGIPAQDTQNFLNMGVNAAMGESRGAVGAASAAGSLDQSGQTSQTASMWDLLMQGLQSGATAYAGR